MIRHARLAAAFAVVPLTVAMIETSFRALLMAAIGGAPLTQTRLLPARVAAIALSAVTFGTEEEHGAAFGNKAKPLSQNHFVVRRHADLRRRCWTTGPASWQVRPVLCDLTKVADPEPRRFRRRGSIHPAFGVTLHRIVTTMIGRLIRAYGADDVAALD